MSILNRYQRHASHWLRKIGLSSDVAFSREKLLSRRTASLYTCFPSVCVDHNRHHLGFMRGEVCLFGCNIIYPRSLKSRLCTTQSGTPGKHVDSSSDEISGDVDVLIVELQRERAERKRLQAQLDKIHEDQVASEHHERGHVASYSVGDKTLLKECNDQLYAFANTKPDPRVDEAIDLLNDMLKNRLVPRAMTCCTLIHACIKARPVTRLEDAMEILRLMEAAELKPNRITYSALISACARARPKARVDDALKLLDKMKQNALSPDVIVYNSLIAACAKATSSSRVEEAMHLLEQIIEDGLKPDVFTYNSLLAACANAKPSARVDIGLSLLQEMEANCVAPNTITYNTLMSACTKAQPHARVDDALALLNRMKANKVAPNERTYSALVTACRRAESGELDFCVGRSVLLCDCAHATDFGCFCPEHYFLEGTDTCTIICG